MYQLEFIMSSSSLSQVAWVALQQVIVTETDIPSAFTDEDILQYILIEQAHLFPTLDQAIYFDFFIKSRGEESQKVVIVACNQSNVSPLSESVLFLKVDHEDFSSLNLLPWRQRNMRVIKKRQLKILCVVVFSASIMMLMVSLFYIHQAHEDQRQRVKFLQRKQALMTRLSVLEKSNQSLQSLVHLWGSRIENARAQRHLENSLRNIEMQRPENLVLDKIEWKESRLFVKGQAKNRRLIQSYFVRLERVGIKPKLNFIGNATNQRFLVQFELEI